jgi:hypothetical protein
MITFDTPYDGVIKQSITKSKIIIKLEGASIESSKIKKVTSRFLHSIVITPMENQTQIVASVPSSVHLIASKTADAYGLRLRFANKTASHKKQYTQNTNSNPLANLPTKKGNEFTKSYYIVVTILVIGIIILFFVRRRMAAKGIKPPKNSNWLFQGTQEKGKSPTKPVATTDTKKQTNQDPISIRFQKSIDENNSVVMLDFAEQSYLILMGKSNILLDKFTDNKPTTQEDFESILQNRHEELNQFLQVEESNQEKINSSFSSSQEALQAYKERAGVISYES